MYEYEWVLKVMRCDEVEILSFLVLYKVPKLIGSRYLGDR